MQLKSLELSGFKSFAKKTTLHFESPITAIVGPNGSGKSNVAESFRFALGEQSIKSLRGKKGEDLIWNGSGSSPRANRAGVKVLFDNGKKLFNVDFDEVVIERVVHRDGITEYLLNGSRVRLRDVVELLAGGNIGVSGHHIISQGEADRILSASIRERRDMVEDALGLKIYQWKREESLRRLEKTRENVAHVEALRKEIAPHLRFLEKQVERIAKAEELRDRLRDLYRDYLAQESGHIAREEARLKEALTLPREELARLERELAEAKKTLQKSAEGKRGAEELLAQEKRLSRARHTHERFAREVGRLEGEIAALEKNLARADAQEGGAQVPLSDVRRVCADVGEALRVAEEAETVSAIKTFIQKARAALRAFLAEKEKSVGNDQELKEELRRLAEEKAVREKEHFLALDEIKEAERKIEALRASIEEEREEGREAEREMFRLMAKQSELRARLSGLSSEEKRLTREREDFKKELAEAATLIGRDALLYESATMREEERSVQDERRRALEKLKIKLEEFGAGGGADVLKEHGEVKERDEFFAKEIADLTKAVRSLETLIADLEAEIDAKFKEGIGKINAEFQKFFSLMFGGGKAELHVLARAKRKRKDELAEALAEAREGAKTPPGGDHQAYPSEELSEVEEGIDIIVSLPHKRIKGLEMLSGGERALTSIALIFAMSQVNPPPFLVLDETDAALDEANSRRYGDMIENLAKHSQLILITHNRETMSRAGILYGVTMGSDGVSKLLSVKFDEAVAVAK